MRSMTARTKYLDFSRKSSLKVVKAYREKYETISRILEENPRIVELAHKDLSRKLSQSRKGRESSYTTDEIVRALVVMFVEQESYRGTVVRIETSEFLQHFVGLGVKRTMDYTFLNKAFGALSSETWEEMNRVLSEYAKKEGKIEGEKLRMDTTVYETNIHYPTDSSLLWDGYRVLARMLKGIQRDYPELELHHRYHPKKVKKLAYFIARNAGSKSKSKQRKVKSTYRVLIERVQWIVEISKGVEKLIKGMLIFDAPDIGHYRMIIEDVISQAQKRVFEGITVPAGEKVYSIFEEHTELLKRGKAGKPVEFGHKVLIAQTGEKFIHHYQAMSKRKEDTALLDPAVDAHRTLFGDPPKVLAADKGFYEGMGKINDMRKSIKVVSIGKKGRRTWQEEQRESSKPFKEGQRFRAGSEGSISVLKRVYKLSRCLFKGFKNYAASLGCAVFCHNLVLLTRL